MWGRWTMWGRAPSPVQAEQRSAGSPRPKSTVLFEGKKQETTIHSREDLRPGQHYPGPAIITEYSATTVIPPDKRFHIDQASNLIVSVRPK